MSSCYSILECYNLFSGVKLSIRSFYFIIIVALRQKVNQSTSGVKLLNLTINVLLGAFF